MVPFVLATSFCAFSGNIPSGAGSWAMVPVCHEGLLRADRSQRVVYAARAVAAGTSAGGKGSLDVSLAFAVVPVGLRVLQIRLTKLCEKICFVARLAWRRSAHVAHAENVRLRTRQRDIRGRVFKGYLVDQSFFEGQNLQLRSEVFLQILSTGVLHFDVRQQQGEVWV